MSHAFHDYLARQLLQHLKRSVVVWYDPRREFEPFIAELRGGQPLAACAVETVTLGGQTVSFCAHAGSFFELRAAVEPLVAIDLPAPLLIYLPGVERDRVHSVLMELEKAGVCYEPQLKRLARNLLRQSYTDGLIDEMLAPESLTYGDVVRLARIETGAGQPSLLRVVFPDVSDNADLLAAWLSEEASDDRLAEKEAASELFKLIGSRLGLPLDAGLSLADARTRTTRYLLVNEWRSSLEDPPPTAIAMIPVPTNDDKTTFLGEVIDRLRHKHPSDYERLANVVEEELGLASGGAVGSGLTFRFEEQAALQRVVALLRERKFDDALQQIEEYGNGFWVQRHLGRKAQWEACRLTAELGRLARATRTALSRMANDPQAWVRTYAAEDGWHRVDQAQRHLEAWVSQMDDEAEADPALRVVRQDYEELLQEMATRFTDVLVQAQWNFAGATPQTRVYAEAVEPRGQRIAYFLVDALRYEMSIELRHQLPDAEGVVLRPALAAVPTVTKVGMAALLPGASSSFDLVAHRNELAPQIEGTILPGLPARLKYFKAHVPGLIDLELHKVLQMSKSQLANKLAGSTVVLVRSQEIDLLGEAGGYLARQVMDTVIGNVARAVRRLAAAGIEHFVITADHGHLFGLERGESMRTDSPGGEELELHRRCWVGRGGQTPAGTVRVSAAELGYGGDLEFVFPRGAGVFKAGGDLAYHHGGVSLQELVIPVLTLRVSVVETAEGPGDDVKLTDVPATLTNRTFGVTVKLSGLFAATLPVKPLVLSDGVQVGEAGMAFDADFDQSTRRVTLRPGTPASIGLILKRDDCKKVRIVIQDAASDRVLAQSEEIPVKLGI
jgi:hypothetical protein